MKSKGIIIGLLVFSIIFPLIAEAATTKTLDKETELHPQGWISGSVRFKAGTAVTLNEQNEVMTGTLAYDESFLTVGNAFISVGESFRPAYFNRVEFMKGKPITFNESGEVLNGNLVSHTDIYLIKKKDRFITFQQFTFIAFDNDGNLLQGTLAHNTLLRPIGWKNYLPLDDTAGFLKFKTETEIFFGPGGQVIKGTIAQDFTTLSKITYRAGTTLQFSETEPPKIIN